MMTRQWSVLTRTTAAETSLSGMFIIIERNVVHIAMREIWLDIIDKPAEATGKVKNFFIIKYGFSRGEHHVVYSALDASSNVGRCEFDIYLAPNDCKAPVPPRKGDVSVFFPQFIFPFAIILNDNIITLVT